MKKNAIVIGAGVGGLAAAIRLQAAGWQVLVLERNPHVGGKLSVLQQGGYRWDAGPSLFTLPQRVTELFALCGENWQQHFRYRSLAEACRYWWEDGSTWAAPAQPQAFAQAVVQHFGLQPQALQRYLQRNALRYRTAGSLFMQRPLHQASTWLNRTAAQAYAHLPAMGLLGTMAAENERQFADPRLQQLFNRYATYNGSDPYQTPGIMNMIAHLEHSEGTYLPHGGMHSIATALLGLAQRQGVQVQLGTAVQRIVHQQGRTTGVQVAGQVLPAQLVVANADMASVYTHLLPTLPPPRRLLRQAPSSSALIYYWGIARSFPQLGLHNIFFSADYRAEFRAIWQQRSVGSDPTVYVNITSKYEPEDAPPGCENWFVMVNVPANSGQNWDELGQRVRQQVLAKLSRLLGQPIEPLIAAEALLDPRSIESRTGSTAGALYGNASNSRWAAFLRHPNHCPQLRGLYLVGGSVHPGGGVPLALASAGIACQLIAQREPQP